MGISREYVSMAMIISYLLNLPDKANILVDQSNHARLADFGLLTIISDPANLFYSSSYTQGGTARWMSPELIAPQRFGLEKSRPTRSSDCYALGMVIYETISGNLPFHKDTDLTVFTKVLEGKHPPRMVRFTESLWDMLELCWTSQLNSRPSIEDVLQCLVIVSTLPASPSPGVDEEIEDVDDWDSGDDSSDIHPKTMTSMHQHNLADE
jgi:serine/threonine protein kinase